NDGVAPGTILARAQAWLQHVQEKTGVVPMIYTGPGYWAQFGAPGGFEQYPLVVANWETSCPHLPASWPRWTFWQDADNGNVPGIKGGVDTDVFNGSLDDLLAFAGGTPPKGGGDAPSDPGTPPAGTCGTLVPNQSLGIDQATTSCDGRFTLVQQGDGNLVLYSDKEGALWATGTDGTTGEVAVMQDDGNLVVYAPGGKPLWDSGTWGHPGAWLAIQDDGNLVIYGPQGKALWDTGTWGH
ncbi:MAG: GH25 family lysozyme, partial [Minicystis sp.]